VHAVVVRRLPGGIPGSSRAMTGIMGVSGLELIGDLRSYGHVCLVARLCKVLRWTASLIDRSLGERKRGGSAGEYYHMSAPTF
jgi:hypothetical protein